MVGGDPLHDGGQDASRAVVPLLERVSLDLAHAMLRLRLGFVHDLADEPFARLGRAESRDPFELGKLSLPYLARAEQLGLQLLLPRGETLFTALEGLQLAIERLLPVQESALGALDGGTLLARLFFCGTTHLQRLVLPLEDDLLLLGAGVGHQAFGIVLGVLDGSPAEQATCEESNDDAASGGDRRHDGDDDGIRHIGSPYAGARDGRLALARRPAHRSGVEAVHRSGRFPIGECSATPPKSRGDRQAAKMRPIRRT